MAEIRAKKNKLLEIIKSELKKGFIDTEVTVGGHKYRLRTLSEDDEVWADSFVRASTPLAMVTSRKAPRLAASISHIDDTPVAQLFEYPDDMSSEMKKGLDENPIQKRYWIYTEMLYFLSEDANRVFINDLWTAFESLEKQRDEATKQIPN